MMFNTLDDILALEKEMIDKIVYYVDDESFVRIMTIAINSAINYAKLGNKDILVSDRDRMYYENNRTPFICDKRNDYVVMCIIKDNPEYLGATFISEDAYIVIQCISNPNEIKEKMRRYFDSLSIEDQCLIAITDLNTIRNLYN